jgi:hypothetical protein
MGNSAFDRREENKEIERNLERIRLPDEEVEIEDNVLGHLYYYKY